MYRPTPHFLAAILGIAALGFAALAFGQAAGDLSLTLTQTTQADGRVVPSLTWSTTPNASRCVASGAWTGSRSVDRSTPLVLSAVTPPASFTLTCYWDDVDADLSWLAPTQNADGSALTNLAGYKIYYGTDPANLDQVISIADPAALARKVTPLAAGVHYFAMTAYNSINVESVRTPTVSITLGSADNSRTVTATASVPQPPANVTVQ